MAGFFYTIRAKLTAKTVPPERAAASFASFSPVVTWGKSFEDRYRHWDKEQKPTRSSIQELTIYKKFIGPIAQGKKVKVQAIAIMSLGCTYDRSSRLNNLYGAWKVPEEPCATKEIGWRARSMVRDAIQHLKNNGFPGGRWWTYPSETGLMRLITEYFDITERAYATDQPFGRFLPVMSCAPKRSTQQPSPLHVDNP